jgi:hypothetical protein
MEKAFGLSTYNRHSHVSSSCRNYQKTYQCTSWREISVQSLHHLSNKKNDSDPWCVAVAARYTQPYSSLSFYVYRKLEKSWVWRCCRSWWSTAIAEMAMAMFDHMCSCLLGSSIKWSLQQLYPFFLHLSFSSSFNKSSRIMDTWRLLCLLSKSGHIHSMYAYTTFSSKSRPWSG